MALVHEINFQKNFGNWESLDLFEFFLDGFFWIYSLAKFFLMNFSNEFLEPYF